jgi:hypothetical protein
VVVLVLGLITVGVLDNPAGTAAAADRTEQSPSPQSPTTFTPSPQSSTTFTPEQSSPLPTTPEQSGRLSAAEWTRTLQALDTQRAQAFWTLDLALLDIVYVPGSKPWVADRALLAEYRRQQLRVQGLRIRIASTTVEHRSVHSMTLRTVDHLVGGEVIDRTGHKTPLPPGSPATRFITLTNTRAAPGWRIAAITSP